MTGLRALVLALLLTLGTVGGVSVVATQGGPSMTVQPVENSSNYFGPNASDVQRSGQASTKLDVAATVSAKAGQVRTTYTDVSLRRKKYANAETDAERRSVVANGTDRLAGRVDALERKEVSAIDRYSRGEISEGDLFRTLAAIDAEARELDETVSWLEGRADSLEMTTERERLWTLRIRLAALHGPVREDITDGLAGANPTRIHAEVADDGGLVLATVVRNGDGEYSYVREAYTPAIRNRRDSDRYEGTGINERLQEIYPWVTEGFPPISNTVWYRGEGADLYSVSYSHEHGGVTPYLDGGTGRIVKEHQRLQVDRVPTDRRNVTTDDGQLVVTIERTYDTGPMAVTVVDNETGVLVDASVLIDGERVARTGRDRIWVVDPRGRTNVTVVNDNRTVTADLQAP